MPVQRCQWASCKNTSDKSHSNAAAMAHVKYFQFPDPVTDIDNCRIWVKHCGKVHTRLNVDIIAKNYEKNKSHSSRYYFVCSDHFPNRKPTPDFPYPNMAHQFNAETPPVSRKRSHQESTTPTSTGKL